MKNSSFNKILSLAIFIFFIATNIAIAQIHYDSSGNVGIGIIEPFYNLDVAGDINFTGDLYKDGTAFEGGGSLWTESGENIYRSSGNVGIGTTNPESALDIEGNLTVRDGSNRFRVDQQGTVTKLFNWGQGNIEILQNAIAGKGITINTNGNVGIGTTNPGGKLEVTGGKTILEQEAWQTPTLNSGWSNYNSTFNPAGYFKDSMGIIHLRGLLVTGGISQTIFTLPVGYRPAYRELQAVLCPISSLGRIDIDAAGNVIKISGGSIISLDGITFRAAGS